MAVMVQVSRFVTPRSRSLRRVATRSPTPSRSPVVGDDGVGVVEVAGGEESVADRAVQRGRLLAGVGHHQHAARVAAAGVAGVDGVGGELRQRLGAFGVTGVDPDLATAPQRVPDLTDPLTTAAHHSLTTGRIRGCPWARCRSVSRCAGRD